MDVTEGRRLADPTLLRSQAYIDGAWVTADDGGTDSIRNPADGQLIATVPRLGGAETNRAIAAAQAAFPAWSGMLAKERAQILRKWFELIMANQEDLARLLTA